MGLWKSVLAFFAPRSRNARRTWDPTTNPFDAERLAKQLRLEEHGRELGRAGVPQAFDNWPSGPEASAVLAVEQAHTDYVASYQLRLMALQAQASRSDISASLAEALASAEQFERQADNLLTDNAAQLQRFAGVAQSRREALGRFREKHRRIELPDYPAKGKRVFFAVAAIAMVLVETALNASFFSKGLGGGLREGMIEAFSFSALNVVGALLAGAFLVRLKNAASAMWRLTGYASTAVVLSLLAALALMVSHYRDALHAGAENAGRIALQRLASAPFDLAGPSSWILFGVSFFFGCIALYEGYSLDERYPGYGAKHRRSEEAARKYDRAVQALRAELAKYRQSLIGRMERTQQACQASIVDLKSVIADKQRLGDEMKNEIQALQSALVAMVGTFRTANRVGREGAAAPDYFNTTPRLDGRALPDFSTKDDEALLKRQEEATSAFLHEKAALCARIESAFNDRYSSLLTVEDLFDPARQMKANPFGQAPATSSTPSIGSSSATVVTLRATNGGVGT